jgi:hypothetical protein
MGPCCSNQKSKTPNKPILNQPICLVRASENDNNYYFRIYSLEEAITTIKVDNISIRDLYNNDNIITYAKRGIYIVFIRPADKAVVRNPDYFEMTIEFNKRRFETINPGKDILCKLCEPLPGERIVFPKQPICIINNTAYTIDGANSILARKGLSVKQIYSDEKCTHFNTTFSDGTECNSQLLRGYAKLYMRVTDDNMDKIEINFIKSERYRSSDYCFVASTKETLDALESITT